MTLASETAGEASSRGDGKDSVAGSRATKLAAGMTETPIDAVSKLRLCGESFLRRDSGGDLDCCRQEPQHEAV